MTDDVHHRRILLMLLAALPILLLAGCKNVRSPEVVKIGLIAPFEGPSRPLGYDTLYAVKLRINQWNESGLSPKIELVALNDDGDPELAMKLPRQLAQDPDIRVILGPPQGHTAMTALPALEESGIPTILLAPASQARISSSLILPYAGLGVTYSEFFVPYLGRLLPAIWHRPISMPSIWLGDPLTLAETLNEHPELILAAGPVAGEEAVQKWTPELAWSIPWAAPMPDNLPDDFPAAYQALTGKPPSYAASLAYAATDQALRIIAAAPDYRPGPDQLHTIPLPPITLMNDNLMQ
jgi:ABC-type branched-subunit amino acid transport system substrate-binding protein